MAVELVIIGDEAWLPEELEKKRQWYRNLSPQQKARRLANAKAWRDAHPERVRAYKREWARRKRALLPKVPRKRAEPKPELVGSLHSLSCTGPTIATGCVCARKGTRKIRCYSVPR